MALPLAVSCVPPLDNRVQTRTPTEPIRGPAGVVQQNGPVDLENRAGMHAPPGSVGQRSDRKSVV